MSRSRKVQSRSVHSAGFTLLEMMLVLAVIGIIVIYATPKYQGLKEHYRLEGSSQAVMAQLKYARQLAMDQRRTTYVALNSDHVDVLQLAGSRYTIIDSKALEPGVHFTYNAARDSWLTSYTDPVTHQFMGYGVTFNYQGFISNYGTIWLDSPNRQVGVKIEEQTGYLSATWP
jgi:prepilin-type N-terminal cleavage/methylation domain-containing protein